MIDVYYISILGEKGGYYEKDLDNVMTMIKEAEYKESYVIRKETMLEVNYNKLPEFMGW